MRSFRLDNKENRRFFGMLGFAMRAGKVIIGTDTVCKRMSVSGAVHLVVAASDASDSTKKKLLTKSEFYNIPAIVTRLRSSELGDLLGKSYAPCALGITDGNFAKEIKKAHEETTSDIRREETIQRKEVSDSGNR